MKYLDLVVGFIQNPQDIDFLVLLIILSPLIGVVFTYVGVTKFSENRFAGVFAIGIGLILFSLAMFIAEIAGEVSEINLSLKVFHE